MKFLLPVIAAALISACATPVDPNMMTLEVITNPPGALIYEDGRALGQAPAFIPYVITPAVRHVGSITPRPITVVWPSGAKATASPGMLLARGQRQHFVFSRPMDAPNLDKDLQYAAQLQQVGYARQQAAAAQRQAEAAESAALSTYLLNTAPTNITCKTTGSKTVCN